MLTAQGSQLTTHGSHFPAQGSPLTTHGSLLANPHLLLFIDTDMYVMKVWCEFVFGNCHRFILDMIIEKKYDLYLLCNTDIPWVADELREYPDLESRRKLYHMYKDIMVNQATPWVDIHGTDDERLHLAVTAVNSLLKQ
jgi:nicotinamide riboside kinase